MIGRMAQEQQQPASVVQSCANSLAQQPEEPSQFWEHLLPELAERVVSFLPINEIACTFRPLNKATAALCKSERYTAVRLSSPVPLHAFKHRWSHPGAMHGKTLQQRHQLLHLTARSGSIPNLELAIQYTGCLLTGEVHGCRGECVIEEAASAGQLEMCQWLQQQGCSLKAATWAAARAGHQAICEWGLALSDCSRGLGLLLTTGIVAAACSEGHVSLVEWLYQQLQLSGHPRLEFPFWYYIAVATGGDLASLQRLGNEELQSMEAWEQASILGAAAGSPTPDWRAKVTWLKAQGLTDHVDCRIVVGLPDALDRLRWLQGRGYPMEASMAREAAEQGNVGALEFLLSEGVEANEQAARAAAAGGHLEALRLLHAHDCPMCVATVKCAARGGHLHVVVWLVETLGDGVLRNPGVFDSAAESGRLELLRWLRGRGCGWGQSTFAKAVQAGCEETLEWLVEEGCPMQTDGAPFLGAARHGDLLTLRCLKRLGCPWGPHGRLITRCIECCCDPRVLSWLRDEGCPVDWDKAGKAAGKAVRKVSCDTGSTILGEVAKQCATRVLEWVGEESGLAGEVGSGM
ncbi:hypothetical protein Agub_g5582 [Astrephomene gubernaculifera]|uniref:Ankyrin repeat domain-containing protein n=1 Tax=Astrephomene gubernaculifera TaxID=47775 RepID=A0AAD3HKW6_9CHLO|nr:hypothetical protein Agub_g5582 [Astrephomene gubernaculifera]